jgi:hypothetical protein
MATPTGVITFLKALPKPFHLCPPEQQGNPRPLGRAVAALLRHSLHRGIVQGFSWSPMSAFRVKVGRYLECGHIGRNVHWRRHPPLGRRYPQVWPGHAVHSPTIGALGGLYINMCHLGVRVCFELFCLICDAVLRPCVPIVRLGRLAIGQGLCLHSVLWVCIVRWLHVYGFWVQFSF